MKSENSQTIAVIDIGASKIVTIVAELQANDKIKILGIGHQNSKGIGRDAAIIDVRNLEYCLINSLSVAEKAAGKDISDVYVNISGNFLKSSFEYIDADISRGELRDRDLFNLQEESYLRFKTSELEVIQSVPISYSIDGISGIVDPNYMTGKKLRAYFNIVRMSASARKNYANCLARCHLNIKSFIPSAYAVSELVLTDEDKRSGALVIDIGKNITDITIYYEDKPVFFAAINLGGALITNDIRQVFCINEKNAERLKVLFGSIFPEQDKDDNLDLFDVIKGEEFDYEHNIQKHQLTDVIYERTFEIFTQIRNFLLTNEVSARYLHNVTNNIILSGGMANLVGIVRLVENVFSGKARVAKPPVFENLADEYKDPSNYVALGLLVINKNLNQKNYFKQEQNKLISRLRKFWSKL